MTSVEHSPRGPLTIGGDSGRDISSPLRSIEQFLLQVAHRLATISLFAMLASWAMLYRGQNYRWPLVATFTAADIGLCAALVALMIARRSHRPATEAMGVLIFNLVFVALSVQMVVFNRLDVIRAAAGAFFSK